MDHKRCKIGPKTPQIYIVHPILMHILSYLMYLLSFKCIQYKPKPQTSVWTLIGDQNPTYEPYGFRTTNGAKQGQKHLKCSSFIPFLCTQYHVICGTYHTIAYNNNLSPKHVCVR